MKFIFKKLNESTQPSFHKQKAIETLNTVKRIYEESESDLLCAGFYDEFMALVDNQIKEIRETTY